jgi:hypothetical protein
MYEELGPFDHLLHFPEKKFLPLRTYSPEVALFSSSFMLFLFPPAMAKAVL